MNVNKWWINAMSFVFHQSGLSSGKQLWKASVYICYCGSELISPGNKHVWSRLRSDTNDLFAHKSVTSLLWKPTWWLSHTLHFISSSYWRVDVMLYTLPILWQRMRGTQTIHHTRKWVISIIIKVIRTCGVTMPLIRLDIKFDCWVWMMVISCALRL